MDTPSSLRHTHALKQIAVLLSQGQSRVKIANDCNMRPSKLEELIHGDEFISILSISNEELAQELINERTAEDDGGTELILQAQGKAARLLVDQLEYAETTAQKRAAAKDIIELAEKLKGKDGAGSNKMTFPPNQLRSLNEAAREMDRASEG